MHQIPYATLILAPRDSPHPTRPIRIDLPSTPDLSLCPSQTALFQEHRFAYFCTTLASLQVEYAVRGSACEIESTEPPWLLVHTQYNAFNKNLSLSQYEG